MRFKIDENLPKESASLFREAGHAADTVSDERLSGTEDSVLLKRCRDEKRIIVTLDLDFADIRSFPPGSHAGIIVLRPNSQDLRTVLSLLKRLVSVLPTRSPEERLWIVESHRIRFRES